MALLLVLRLGAERFSFSFAERGSCFILSRGRLPCEQAEISPRRLLLTEGDYRGLRSSN